MYNMQSYIYKMFINYHDVGSGNVRRNHSPNTGGCLGNNLFLKTFNFTLKYKKVGHNSTIKTMSTQIINVQTFPCPTCERLGILSTMHLLIFPRPATHSMHASIYASIHIYIMTRANIYRYAQDPI